MYITEEIIQQPKIVTTKDLLKAIPVPDNTRTYKNFSHSKLMDITLEGIDRSGFKLKNESYTLSSGGLKANGKYQIDFGEDKDMGLLIAWQNSYDKTLSMKYAVGCSVFICENGMVKGDMGALRQKHQSDIQIESPKKIKEFIEQAGEHFNVMVAQKERMKEIEVTKRTSSELLGRLFMDDAIITSTQLNIIKNQFENPTFDYGFKGSTWELMNHCTFALKEDNPSYWLTRQQNVHSFFEKEFSL